MSSTDEREEAARRFFEDVLVPLAGDLRREGRAMFPRGPDADSRTYYITRTRRRMEREDFEIAPAQTPEDVHRALAGLWKDDPHLRTIADRLAALIPLLRPKSEQPDDVSPFIYVMF